MPVTEHCTPTTTLNLRINTAPTNYHPLDVVIERADGVWVYDVEGRR